MYDGDASTTGSVAVEPLAAEPMGTAWTFEVVRTAERLGQIEPAWNTLWARVDGSLFQSHGWIEAWWRTAPDRPVRSLAIGLCWRGAELHGVMALVVTRWRGLRVLEWAAKDHTDYCDALVAPGDERKSIVARLWASVNRECRFDLVYLSHLLPDASARGLMAENGPVRLRVSDRSTRSLRIDGTANGNTWFDGLSKKVRKDLRRKQRLLAESGPVRFRLTGADEPLGPVIDRLAELKRHWGGGKGFDPPLLADDAAALRHLVDVMAARGRLRLFVLECGDRIAAGAIAFVEGGRTMVFLITHDPEFGRASPGVLLMTEYVRWSFDRGIETVDFLCGEEGFKARFATSRVTVGAFCGGRTWPGRLALRGDAARAAARALVIRHRGNRRATDGSDPAEI